MQSREYDQSETDRRLPNIIRIGTVSEADYKAARLRVAFGTAVSDWLPWITFRAGGDSSWWAPEVGEQVVVLSPSGETAGGVVLGSMFSNSHPAPTDRPTIHRTTYEDGAVLEYDRLKHILHAYIPGFKNREVDLDMNTQVHRDVFWNIDRDYFRNIERNRTDTIGGDVSVDVGGDVQHTVGGKVILDVEGEVVINSATRVTLSAPKLVFDGPIHHGNGTHGGGAEFFGEIIHRDGDFVQQGGDTISEGVSLQHHVHVENGTVTDEPSGGA